jgi:hypothetical protein
MNRTGLVGRASLIISWCAVTVVVMSVLLLQMPRLASWLGAGPDPVAYDRGDRIDLPPELYAASDFTALLFVRSDCVVCQETKTLYAEVVRELKTVPGAGILAVIGAPRRDDDTSYAEELGLDATESASVEFTSLRLRRVPTLVIVDRAGSIIRSWEGAPPLAEQHDFAASVRPFFR